jgi:hypothetical protein
MKHPFGPGVLDRAQGENEKRGDVVVAGAKAISVDAGGTFHARTRT